jgi:hypothetical protein
MRRPCMTTLFSVLLLASRAQVFADTTSSTVMGGAQRDPYWLILLGAAFIGGAICLRQIKKDKRKDSAPQGPQPPRIEPTRHAH